MLPYAPRVSVEPTNSFVEGDNLDVLARLPEASYDLVYIDPPYNTGHDFAYADDFRQAGGGRRSRHDAWVAMMRPRLEQARRVLAVTGAIAVSIDDGEMPRLRLLMDEVFGEDQLLAQVVVNLNPKGRQLGGGFAVSHEYLLVYAVDAPALRPGGLDLRDRRSGGLPAGGLRRAALSAPAAAQHQQEVQPGHRTHPALPAVG